MAAEEDTENTCDESADIVDDDGCATKPVAAEQPMDDKVDAEPIGEDEVGERLPDKAAIDKKQRNFLIGAAGIAVVVVLAILVNIPNFTKRADDTKFPLTTKAATTQTTSTSSSKYSDSWTLDKEVEYQGVKFTIGSKWVAEDGLAADPSNTTGHVLYRIPESAPLYFELMTSTEGKAKFPNNAIVKTGTLFKLDTHYGKSSNGEALETWWVMPEDQSNDVINCICLISNDPDTNHGYMGLVKSAPGSFSYSSIESLLYGVASGLNITPEDMTVGYEEGFEEPISVPVQPAKTPEATTDTEKSATPTAPAPAPVTTTPVSTTPKSTGTRVTDFDLQGTLLANAQAIVKDHLKGPSSAKFPALFDEYNFIDQGSSSKHYGYETYRISGSVEAINSFNAMLKSNWVVVLDYDKDTGKYYEVSCDISE